LERKLSFRPNLGDLHKPNESDGRSLLYSLAFMGEEKEKFQRKEEISKRTFQKENERDLTK
jgi:hypothetical protein